VETDKRKAICGICSAGCWVEVTYDEEGKMAKVEADKTSSLGIQCRVGERSPEIVYSEDRLLYPMKRKGPKGTYEFERISWDEAYDIIVKRLHTVKEEFGPEANAIYTGSGSFELSMCDIFQPKGVAVSSASSVLFPFGSPNTLGVGALCYVSFAMIAPHVTMGSMYINMFTDIERAKQIVIWGKNPAAHCPPYDFERIMKAYNKGVKIVVIDPRKTAIARYPNTEWIPIRPGTDGALALGLCNILINEELYDEEFVKEWTVGFPEFIQYVTHFTPEVVEHITGVPAETVISLTRRIAESDGVAPVMYSGLEYSDGAVQAIRAVITFWALAGQLDVPGGWCFKMHNNMFPINRGEHIENPNIRKAAGYNNFPIYTKYRGEFHANILPKAVLEGKPYPIKLLISLGASIITSWPQSEVWRKTLAGLDFLVCIDRQMTADMAYADIVLPACTYYEIESYMIYDSVFRIREKVIEPVGEARNDFFIQAELAKRLGYGHLYPQTEEELLRLVLKDSGFSLEDVRENGGMIHIPTEMIQYKKWEKGLLRKDRKPGFETPTGKFEIASSILEEYGYDALPIYSEPGEGPLSQPELAKKFPLIFNSGARSNVDLHTLHHSIPSLKKDKPLPTVMINTKDAKTRKIENGDLVSIVTKRGRVNMYAIVTHDIVEGAIEANAMGGGALGSKEWREACVNDLTDVNRYDPISGFPVYKALLCDVVKVGEGTKGQIAGSGEYTADLKFETPDEATRIYLDNNATTPLSEEVKNTMMEFLDTFGNPSSLYSYGKDAKIALEDARRKIAHLINCTPKRVLFTGSGSEANNLAIKGTAFGSLPKGKNHIITSSIEHPSVTNTCKWLETQGFTVTYLPVDEYGRVNPEDLRTQITEKTCLVSIMLANNETGVIQPIAELAEIAHSKGILFHTDAVQGVGKIPVDVKELGVDMLTLSSHKLMGPKGVGALYLKKDIELEPLVTGGHQERGLRAGTENLLGIIGFGKAAELATDGLSDMERVKKLRDRLQDGIMKIKPEAKINGHQEYRLPNTLNVTFPKMRGESIVAVRISLGHINTEEEIERTLEVLEHIINEQEAIVRFVSCR
jgi:cysteine sulfinate desulfinase/cysteine desulfurase-like protein/anaerobic selenocysteine-containing dehydrogenase